jgi:beta-1,2-mannosidase
MSADNASAMSSHALSRRAWIRTCAVVPVLLLPSAQRSDARQRTVRTEPTIQPWAIGPFTRELAGAPILAPRPDSRFACPVSGRTVAWEEKDVFNPAALVRDGRVHLLYRAEDVVGTHAGTSRIGLATSDDGLHFERRGEPVLYPDDDDLRSVEWDGGCEDPRVIETDDGRYVMTYTAYDGKTARLCIASSNDLIRWKKHGLAFGKVSRGTFRDTWSKSGAIVGQWRNGRLVATRVDGQYWMYWGDTDIFIASSGDLIDWTPLERADTPGGKPRLVSALAPRDRRFDSALVEPGPPAMLTRDGILLLYNGANRQASGDPKLPEMAYSGGQVLFDPQDPSAVIARATAPFLTVKTAQETTGQVGNVCFVEGLVQLRGRWLLYYGMGDSRIGVAAATAH